MIFEVLYFSTTIHYIAIKTFRSNCLLSFHFLVQAPLSHEAHNKLIWVVFFFFWTWILLWNPLLWTYAFLPVLKFRIFLGWWHTLITGTSLVWLICSFAGVESIYQVKRHSIKTALIHLCAPSVLVLSHHNFEFPYVILFFVPIGYLILQFKKMV